MRILITGAAGQLGNELRRILEDGAAEIGPIPAEYGDAEVVCADRSMLDIVDRDVVLSYVGAGSFDLIVNCAAMTDVDGCERAEEAAYLANAVAPGNLAEAAAASGAKLVHVSTDYVFPGNDPRPRVETDPVGPTGAYGRTKLAGERAVAAHCRRSFIVRTAWLYGYVGKNFVKTMLRLARQSGAIKVVDDQRGNPTTANDLAYEILKIALTDDYGIYHCTNKGTCSWFDFACAIVEAAGIECVKTPCSSDEFPSPTKRPSYSSLSNGHLEETIGDEMRDWRDALAEYIKRLPELEG